MRRHLSCRLPILLCLVFGITVVIVCQVALQIHGTGLFRKGWKEILPAEDRGEVSMPAELINVHPVVRNWQGEFYAFGGYCGDAYCWALLEFDPALDCYAVYPHSFCISVEQVPLADCDTSLPAFREFNHPPQGLSGCLVNEQVYSGRKSVKIVGQVQRGGIWMFEYGNGGASVFTQCLIFAGALLAGLLGWLVGRGLTRTLPFLRDSHPSG